MDFFELFFESLNTLTVNKLRTALAILGIVIGIGSVIALVSLGESSQKSVQEQIQSLGANLLTVMPAAQTTGGVRGAIGGATTLTYEDAKAIQTDAQITTIKNVSPELQRRTQVTVGRNNTNTQIIGVVPSYAEVRRLSMASGVFISQRDVDNMSKVAVLGPQVVSDLFPTLTNPVGQTIRINKIAFRVIGVTESKGGSGFQNQDDVVFVPLTTAQKIIFGVDNITSLAIEARSEDDMLETQNQVGYFLLARHKLSDPSQADFMIISQNDILNTASQVTGTFTALLTGIAAISLLVGGIGIMNIMLVTVTERTREIGLRKALGAKKNMVITQFLIEALTLTFIGGIFGMIIGVLISYIISRLINLPFTISPQAVFLAVGVSGIAGVLFGLYPAKRASDLQPIEALRYE